MAFSIDDIRNFAGTDRLLFDAQGGTLKSVNVSQRFKSFFSIGDARTKNAETLVAIHHAIINDPRFFAKEVQAAAVSLLANVRTDRAISVAQIKDIVAQLDSMSTDKRRREVAQDLVGAHLAARVAERGLPAFLPQSAEAAYVELAKDLVPPRPEPQGGFGRMDYAAALDAFDAKLAALFTRLGNGAGDREVFAGILFEACKGKDQAELDAVVDALRANLDESRALGAQYGDQTRLDAVAALHRLGHPIAPTAANPHPLRTLVEAGRAIRVPSLEDLNGRSPAGDIDRGLADLMDAVGRVPLPDAAATPEERAAFQSLLMQSAVESMLFAVKSDLLGALESDAGRNLLSLYAEESADKGAKALSDTAGVVGQKLLASLGGQPLPIPPHPDPTRLPPAVLSRYSFSVDRFLSGNATDLMKGPAEKFVAATAGDPKAFRRRSTEIGSAMSAFSICEALMGSLHVVRDAQRKRVSATLHPDDRTKFAKDQERDFRTRLPDGTVIDKNITYEEARTELLRFVTGDDNATWTPAMPGQAEDPRVLQNKLKVLILMGVLDQAAVIDAPTTIARTISEASGAAAPIPHLQEDLDRRIQGATLSKAANGDISVHINFQAFCTLALDWAHAGGGAVNHVIQLDPESYYALDMEIKFPAAHLDALSRADWTQLDLTEANKFRKREDLAGALATLPDELRFAGTTEVSAHYHLVKA